MYTVVCFFDWWHFFLQEYQKALEDADEKVNIATQTYDLVSQKSTDLTKLHIHVWNAHP